MKFKTLSVDTDGKVAILCLNRPHVHNAVNRLMIEELEDCLNQLYGNSDILVLILTGAGDTSFCAGGDLKYFAELTTREQALQLSHRLQSILNQLWLGNKFVIGAVNGQALGGGCEILTACHYCIASENAAFSFRQAANGVLTGWGGGVRLFRQFSRAMALRLLLTAEIFDAEQALEMGFINQIAPGEQLMERSLALAGNITQNSQSAIRAFMSLHKSYMMQNVADAVNTETELFADLWVGDDFRNWLGQFLKREK
jgi:enoyl-CoA hydratase